jgi:hypothetical protein
LHALEDGPKINFRLDFKTQSWRVLISANLEQNSYLAFKKNLVCFRGQDAKMSACLRIAGNARDFFIARVIEANILGPFKSARNFKGNLVYPRKS